MSTKSCLAAVPSIINITNRPAVFRATWLRTLATIACVAACLFTRSEAQARPDRVFLLRHAEKPENARSIQLSERGQERARRLVGFFGARLDQNTNNPPVALFATRPTKGAPSVRTRETLAPLAEKLKLTIHQPFRSEEYAFLARYLLRDPAFDGKTVIVCWTHDELPALARALGADPKPRSWKSDIYDRVWAIEFKKKKVDCKTVLQESLPGDERENKN